MNRISTGKSKIKMGIKGVRKETDPFLHSVLDESLPFLFKLFQSNERGMILELYEHRLIEAPYVCDPLLDRLEPGWVKTGWERPKKDEQE